MLYLKEAMNEGQESPQAIQNFAPVRMSRVDAQVGLQAFNDSLMTPVPAGMKEMCCLVPEDLHEAGHLLHLVEASGQPLVDVTDYVANLPVWKYYRMMAVLRALLGQS